MSDAPFTTLCAIVALVLVTVWVGYIGFILGEHKYKLDRKLP